VVIPRAIFLICLVTVLASRIPSTYLPAERTNSPPSAGLSPSANPLLGTSVAGSAGIPTTHRSTATANVSDDRPNKPIQPLAPHGSGCFVYSYLDTDWEPTLCGAAPLRPMIASETRPSTVGNGHDEVAQSPGTVIGSAIGSFQSISGLTSESDSNYGANYYSLQLNSQFLSGVSTPYTDNRTTTGWEQFVYSNSGWLFIQFWLFGYQSAYGSCPAIGPPSGTPWFVDQGSC
jgi:hypothetical protein